MKRDDSGQIINGLRLNKRIDDYIPPNSRGSLARYNCTCQLCGNDIDLTIQHIRKRDRDGCGCQYKNTFTPKPWKMHDIVNQRFGKCVAKERLSDGKWRCLCDCGTWFVTSISHLTTGHTSSCGCYRRQTSHSKLEDLSGRKYHELTPIQYHHSRKSPNGKSSAIWLCLCSCGTYTMASSNDLKTGKVKSCGCIGSSYREKQIRKWLKENNVTFCTEYKFDDLKYKRQLRFDFAILNNDSLLGLIEHQGRQHFKEFSKTTNWGKLQREVTDSMKIKYCKEHNIPLYAIRFDADIDKSLKTILAELHVNTVPSLQETA